MNIEEILGYLDKHEIDYRLESDHWEGYIFTFIDPSVYPRRWIENAMYNQKIEIVSESVDNLIEKSIAKELKKDWLYRIAGKDIIDTFEQVEKYIKENYI